MKTTKGRCNSCMKYSKDVKFGFCKKCRQKDFKRRFTKKT